MFRTALRLSAAAALAVGIVAIAPAPAFASVASPAAAAAAADPGTYEAILKPVTANHVTGTGDTWLTLKGNQALFQLQVSGLVDAMHAAHVHIGAQGGCPTAAQAKLHNGHLSTTVTDAAGRYGTIGATLTVSGDSSPASAAAVDRFPSGGKYTYSRTITLPPAVVAAIKGGTAVMVVHGIDYNGNGKYDSVLGASDLAPALPAEATDPALCGTFIPAQMVAIPTGSADTGGGSAAASDPMLPAALGAITLVGAVAAAAVAVGRRRRGAQG